MKTTLALIDCNNFFVSCERLFRPDLEGKPVVVLSSNDGCAIARSNEAKALGIPMGAPVFKYRQLFKQQGVVQFSANFDFYGDISERITRLLTSITPRIEVYSVDESFLELTHLEINDYSAWGRQLCRRILREVGVPVSIGIAPSKTLAKLAAERAKKDPGLAGALSLQDCNPLVLAAYLELVPIKDVWGVGWRLTPRLKAEGLHNALDLAQFSPRHAQQLMGIQGRQLVSELNGLSCHPLEPFRKVRQTLTRGRMFGEDTNEFQVIEAAIMSLTARAALALRHENLLARSASLSLSTNRHKPGYQRSGRSIAFQTPTADSGLIASRLVEILSRVYNPQASYHRANISLRDFVAQSSLQADLFGSVDIVASQRQQDRLQAVDSLNERYGKHSVHYAAEDLSHAWQPRHRLRSPRYTTDWQELPVIGLSSNNSECSGRFTPP